MHFPRVKSFTDIVDQVRDAMRPHKHEKDSEAHQVRLSNRCQHTSHPSSPDISPSGRSPAQRRVPPDREPGTLPWRNPYQIIRSPWHLQDEETVPGIEHPGSTGVIYCSDRAMANGFSYADSHAWANLGQGAPEVGPIPNGPSRPQAIPVPEDSLEYAPTTGVKGLTSSFLSYPRTKHFFQPFEKPSHIYIMTHTARERTVSTLSKTSVSSQEGVLVSLALPL